MSISQKKNISVTQTKFVKRKWIKIKNKVLNSSRLVRWLQCKRHQRFKRGKQEKGICICVFVGGIYIWMYIARCAWYIIYACKCIWRREADGAAAKLVAWTTIYSFSLRIKFTTHTSKVSSSQRGGGCKFQWYD